VVFRRVADTATDPASVEVADVEVADVEVASGVGTYGRQAV